jgi:CarboxypepD_reg-like domain
MKVSIEKPCSESWEQMDDLGQSRFCANCQKCVTDFTQMSDRAIVQFLQNQSGEVCGRFNESQLERDLFAVELKQNKYLNAFFSMTLASALGFSQEAKARPMHPLTIAHSEKDSVPSFKNQLLTSKDSTLLGGIVQDAATGKPLFGATVMLEDTNIGAKTDVNGQFEFTVANHLIQENKILTIFYIDYEFKIIDLSTVSMEKPLAILLAETPVACQAKMVETKHIQMIMGATYATLPIKTIKPSFKSKVKHFFKRIFN